MRRFTVLLSLLLLILTCVSHAETQRKTLTNGVRILLTPVPSSEFLAVAVYVKWAEPTDIREAAIQELAGRAMFFGSLNRSFESVGASVRQVGGSLDVQVTPQFLVITCLTVPSQVSETAYLLGEALKNADFSEDALRRARLQVLREAKQRLANPYENLRYELLRKAKGTLTWTPEELTHVTQKVAYSYFHKYVVPESVVVSLAGSFDAEKAVRTFDNNLFELHASTEKAEGGVAKTGHGDTTQGGTPKGEVLTLKSRDSVAYAMLSMPSASVTSTAYPAFLTLQALLGVGYQSRLLRHFREEQGIGYEMGVTFYPQYGESLFAQVQWDTSTGEQGASKVATQIGEQLRQVVVHSVTAPLTDTELNRAKQIAIGRLALIHERILERAALLGWYEAMGVGYGFDKELPALIRAVSREDIFSIGKLRLEALPLGIVQP